MKFMQWLVLISLCSLGGLAQAASCPLPAATPANGSTPATLIVSQAYTIPIGSTCSYDYVNIVNGGRLTFSDGQGETNFTARSILVEQGGAMERAHQVYPLVLKGVI